MLIKRCISHRLLLLLSTFNLLRYNWAEENHITETTVITLKTSDSMDLAIKTDGVIELNIQNLDTVLKSAQLVFVAFCADWCPFSRRLKPIFEEAAKKWHEENPKTSVIWALVDSVAQADVADKYFVNKYPTMKIFMNGELINKEYRSTRTVDALIDFVKKLLEVTINEFDSMESLTASLDKSKRNIISYFNCRKCPEYENFMKVVALLREDCVFWISKSPNNTLVFWDPGTDDMHKYTETFTDYKFMKNWVTDKCIPLVREVTFENVEELTEEGLPFLIFFRDPNDKENEKLFREMVTRELYDQKSSVNALIADGHKFAHPLKHLGKSAKDLPVLAIDSFQHMFLFDNMKDLPVAGKLRQFVLDLHSGKLHKHFHETLDERIAQVQKAALEQMALAMQGGEMFGDADESREPKPPSHAPLIETTLKPSVFKDLKPSDKRYSLLKEKVEL